MPPRRRRILAAAISQALSPVATYAFMSDHFFAFWPKTHNATAATTPTRAKGIHTYWGL
jgi:hypothetical protein